MRIGLFSDAHGNLAALEAVLADMQARQVDQLVFLGDAYGELGEPCETVDRLRGLPGLCAIHGNRERYLLALDAEDQATWTSEQYAPLYWNYRELGAARRDWLTGLPDEHVMYVNGLPPIHLAHEGLWHAPCGATERVSGAACVRWSGQNGTLTRASLLTQAQSLLAEDAAFPAEAAALAPGVYALGHSHVQWHAAFDGRLFINPGSCGLPQDLAAGAPYTLLEARDGAWHVEECRVAYDVPGTLRSLRHSGLYAASEIFGRIIMAQLRDARPYWGDFLHLAEAMAAERGEGDAPVANGTFRDAAVLWFSQRHPL